MGGRSLWVRRNIPGALPQTRRYTANVFHQPRDIVSDFTISQSPIPGILDTVAPPEFVLQKNSKKHGPAAETDNTHGSVVHETLRRKSTAEK